MSGLIPASRRVEESPAVLGQFQGTNVLPEVSAPCEATVAMFDRHEAGARRLFSGIIFQPTGMIPGTGLNHWLIRKGDQATSTSKIIACLRNQACVCRSNSSARSLPPFAQGARDQHRYKSILALLKATYPSLQALEGVAKNE
jgi:hypothetical protein